MFSLSLKLGLYDFEIRCLIVNNNFVMCSCFMSKYARTFLDIIAWLQLLLQLQTQVLSFLNTKRKHLNLYWNNTLRYTLHIIQAIYLITIKKNQMSLKSSTLQTWLHNGCFDIWYNSLCCFQVQLTSTVHISWQQANWK